MFEIKINRLFSITSLKYFHGVTATRKSNKVIANLRY